ncbi:alkaline shock response membrane anchor protein AmaP [Nocardia sp. NPDC005978]|uniref:alkaline shock response membrane anchor protein AmaP n=1 Tax=unclassified Nocardia TaxID=2637762 RepID=UPI00339DDE14
MTAVNRPARLNRTLLAVIGVLLVAAGAYLIAAQRGWLGWVHRSDALTPGDAAPRRWVFYLTIVGAAVLALLCLRWLAAQFFRMPTAVEWQLTEADSPDATTLSSAVAAAAVAADIESLAGVESAAAWLTGPTRAPELHLILTVAPDADVTELRGRIDDEAVARLRQALAVPAIAVATEVRLSENRARVR